MNYREYKPNPLLNSFIETYWVSDGFKGTEVFHKILPDGCVDIIFICNRMENYFHADIIGTMTTFINVNFPEYVQIFGIRFKPVGITAFTRNPIQEFTNRNVELASVETLFHKSFCESLFEKRSIEEIIILTDDFLINSFPHYHRLDKQIIDAVNLISARKGQLSLSQTASEVCLSQRHFERKFKSTIGITPKSFAKITRFKHALCQLKNHSQKDLLSIAVECGYYDHAHLIKDFKTISGSTPNGIRH